MSAPPPPAPSSCWPRSAEIGDQLRRATELVAARGAGGQRDQRGNCRAGALRAGDRRGGRSHPQDRRADQFVGAQRHDRGGARRRIRPRLCGGRSRGQIAGGADREGHRANRGADLGGSELPPAPPSKPFAAIPRACRKSTTIRRRSPPRSTSRTRATEEISHNVSDAAQGTKTVADILNEVAAALTETRRSAETVLGASENVETAATALRGEVEGFLAKVVA